jgi:hypothetical protein
LAVETLAVRRLLWNGTEAVPYRAVAFLVPAYFGVWLFLKQLAI